ncbi:DMT family transporter [Planktotalea arctica]|uniref:DMT family transporter n=1 Tax=Planktotalea arctica TaxID=1481893 RepID=UPI00321B2AF6
MKLFWLIAAVMTAFASNSILNRLALATDGSGAMEIGDMETGPASYAMIRLIAGAVTLALLVLMRGGARPKLSTHALWSAGMLLLYALGFSYAYITLPTGPGALILFGAVQVMSFAITLARGHSIGALSWMGAALAFGGLCYLLWPDGADPIDKIGAGLMLLAAVGWTLYTLAGARGGDPLGATALAFILAAPVAVIAWILLPDSTSLRGALLAILSGAVTSGMGYALWYRVLPQISLPSAAVAQLTVPVIAALGGALFLGEALTLRFAVATCAVLCGVGLTIYSQSMRK